VDELIERLNDAWRKLYGDGDEHDVCDTLAEAIAALEAAREDANRLREILRTVSAVGVVQLFDTARDDVLAEFSLAELQEIVRVTEHKRPEQVERIYREGWVAAIDQARGKAGGEVGS